MDIMKVSNNKCNPTFVEEKPEVKEKNHQETHDIANKVFEHLLVQKKDFKTLNGGFLKSTAMFPQEKKDDVNKMILPTTNQLPEGATEEKLQYEQRANIDSLSFPPTTAENVPSALMSNSTVSSSRKRRANDLRGAEYTRGDVPTSLNPFDINRVTENLQEFMRKELDYMILINLLDIEMRETITLAWTSSLCILQVIEELLAQAPENRDFAKAQRNLQDNLEMMKKEELRCYESLINSRTHVIKKGVEEKITSERKAELLTSFEALVDQKFSEAKCEFSFPNLDLEKVKEVLELRLKEKILLKDDLLDAKVTLQMKNEALKKVPEYKQLQQEINKLKGEYLSSTIWEAADKGDIECLKSILAENTKNRSVFEYFRSTEEKFINKKNQFGYTPLHIASYKGREACVDFLLEKEASIRIGDKNGYNSLHWAASQGHVSICKKFLEKDPSVVNAQALAYSDKRIEFGFKRTALHRAVWHGHVEIVNLLLRFGANVNLQTSQQNGCLTPLHEAINQEKDTMIVTLVNHPQLNVEIPDAWGRTALYFAVLNGRTDYIARIVAHSSYKQGKDASDQNSIESLLTVKPLNNAEKVRQCLEGFMASTIH
jgi:ankyrin repeat protein